MTRVWYEAAGGDAEFYDPDEYHTDQDPLLTLLWTRANGNVRRKVHVPITRVIRIEDHD